MSVLFCCCVSPSEDNDERQPLLHTKPSKSAKPESARQPRSAPTVRQSGRLVPKRVGLIDLDQRFSDVAVTFNQQQESYDAMKERIISLRRTYDCNNDSNLTLTECVRKIKEEHKDSWCVTMVMKGYDFSLSVVPLRSAVEGEESPPSRLRLAQEELWAISQGAKVISAAGTKLQELIGWLLSGAERMAEQVREAAPTHQDRCRLEENLIETMQEVRRARELSLSYRQRAGEVQTEAAQVAGLD
ncbi:uncharacterized protein [Salmo salar]|uniref:Uncharacterized protein n=1 Tax=Salmo salar TaxID=8030 RepID=A0A1S3M5Q3_SALSA|nr:uncharacterized protein LOC106570583 [Salmo salar]|eukprot:XP_013998507.1 PREDICTED: uncharacterized protein LOC106570583 [Salmo salar]